MKTRFFAAVMLLFLCLWLSFDTAQKIKYTCLSVSLRYEDAAPLTAEHVMAARAFAQDSANENTLYPSFWRETKSEIRAHQKQENATVLYFLGSGDACFPAEFIAGGYPGDADANGCALSAEAAWRLFGSNDILGQELVLQKKTYAIRGVFKGRESVCLVGATEKTPFAAMELVGTNAADRRGQSLDFVQKAGLPKPAQIVYGPSIAAAVQALCFLPLCVCGAFLWAALWRKSKTWRPAQREFFWFGAALCFALALPFLLAQLPAWLIPAKWSDVSFWQALWHTATENLRAWLALVPSYKDVVLKERLLYYALTLTVGIRFTQKVCRLCITKQQI
ncbi:MAG: ABC transporter permease [Ruthenibacterium sp.]